jgi:hypothetical protein
VVEASGTSILIVRVNTLSILILLKIFTTVEYNLNVDYSIFYTNNYYPLRS